MYVQIAQFRLDGMPLQDYAQMCADVAPRYAGIEGCLGKIFVRSPDGARYGGVYLWRTRAQAEAYAEHGLLATLARHPQVVDLRVSLMEVMPEPTAVSAGALAGLLDAA